MANTTTLQRLHNGYNCLRPLVRDITPTPEETIDQLQDAGASAADAIQIFENRYGVSVSAGTARKLISESHQS